MNPSRVRHSEISALARIARGSLTLITAAFIGLFVLLPLINVFAQAFSKGVGGYVHTFFAAPPRTAFECPFTKNCKCSVPRPRPGEHARPLP
jgi:ABC-type sulfate transport system permease subunit